MRVLLFTGKGGVGKTTVAASTAAAAARAGKRVMVMSTDPAHSLADSFDVEIGSETTALADNLWAQQIDAQHRLEQNWREIQEYFIALMNWAGVDTIQAEELSVIPGLDEIFSLIDVKQHVESQKYDLLVVDCAPTAETLRLLALPEALGWYMTRVFPVERRVVRALKPMLSRAAGVPMPEDDVFGAVERLHAELDQVRALLAGPDSGVRLVLTPEQVVLAEARRSFTTLSLFGYRVDGVVANRVFPDTGGDAWRAGWVRAQTEVLAEVEQSFAGIPVWRSEFRATEPVGLAELLDVGRALYAGADPLDVHRSEEPLRITRSSEGAVLRLRLPFVGRGDVDLARDGDDLVVTVASYRRLLTLPAGLARRRVAGARVDGGELQVRFAGERSER
jgi:arsenite-transporting ATPase